MLLRLVDNWVMSYAEDKFRTTQLIPSPLHVQLIDFGRALSVTQTTPGYVSSDSPQSVKLQMLYQNNSIVPYGSSELTSIEYVGNVSCKHYQCAEMQQKKSWSFQVLHNFYITNSCGNILLVSFE